MLRGTVPSCPWRPRCGVKHAWQKYSEGLPTLCRFSQWVNEVCSLFIIHTRQNTGLLRFRTLIYLTRLLEHAASNLNLQPCHYREDSNLFKLLYYDNYGQYIFL